MANIDSVEYLNSDQYTILLSYTINNKQYNNTIISNTNRIVGTSIPIYYTIDDPNNISEYSVTRTIIGGGLLIFFAVIVCLILIFNVYTVKKYNKAAIFSIFW